MSTSSVVGGTADWACTVPDENGNTPRASANGYTNRFEMDMATMIMRPEKNAAQRTWMERRVPVERPAQHCEMARRDCDRTQSPVGMIPASRPSELRSGAERGSGAGSFWHDKTLSRRESSTVRSSRSINSWPSTT